MIDKVPIDVIAVDCHTLTRDNVVSDYLYSLVFLTEAPPTSCWWVESRFVVSRLCCCWFHME